MRPGWRRTSAAGHTAQAVEAGGPLWLRSRLIAAVYDLITYSAGESGIPWTAVASASWKRFMS